MCFLLPRLITSGITNHAIPHYYSYYRDNCIAGLSIYLRTYALLAVLFYDRLVLDSQRSGQVQYGHADHG